MKHFDLIIIGSGSGNSIISPELDDWDIAMVESSVWGGTCLNRGCIPSKMLVYAADIAELARSGPALGVNTQFAGADWSAIRDRVFSRIDPIAAGGRSYRIDECENVSVFEQHAVFVGLKQLKVGDEVITADRFVLAAGAHAHVPEIDGLDTVPFHTSDSIMRIDAIPERLTILGGGFIASELGHVFGALGSDVTIVNRSDRLLRAEDSDVSRVFTERMAERFNVHLDSPVRTVAQKPGGEIVVSISSAGHEHEISGDTLLVATGRTPNGADLGVTETCVELDQAGHVVVDEHGQTSVEGIWALGDITNPNQLKHTANAEARVVAHNLAHPDDLASADLRYTPHAVFGSPQVASVGPTEAMLVDAGTPYRSVVRYYRDAAYGWAMEDTTSLVKLIADPTGEHLLAAHIVGPQASTLIQQLIMGMAMDISIEDMARGHLYIHPALPEVIEQALLEFG